MDQQRLVSLQESIEEARSQSMVVAVDRIFTTSIALDGDAIGKCLCSKSTSANYQKKMVTPKMCCL